VSLPANWIDAIWDKLSLTYGQAFIRRWADMDLNAVKSDWAHELSGFKAHPKAIAWALQNLPADKPPTVLDFKFLARRAPPDELPRLEAPKADPERVAAELAKLAPVLKERPQRSNLDWAKRIVARAEGGSKLSPLTLRMAREALANKGEVTV
jgi:hypothetical protein